MLLGEEFAVGTDGPERMTGVGLSDGRRRDLEGVAAPPIVRRAPRQTITGIWIASRFTRCIDQAKRISAVFPSSGATSNVTCPWRKCTVSRPAPPVQSVSAARQM